jgi:hypothetical protein
MKRQFVYKKTKKQSKIKTSTVTIMSLINAERHIYFTLYIRVHSYARSFLSHREERS